MNEEDTYDALLKLGHTEVEAKTLIKDERAERLRKRTLELLECMV